MNSLVVYFEGFKLLNSSEKETVLEKTKFIEIKRQQKIFA